ncbi:MAG TPA: hypothetical protein VKD43_00795 [Xanthobacteraceae bacterium]|nr:hypothetical protein [Xanthobacteraceae bacterium]
MDIEHCDCLSWFSRKDESHEQDGERLIRAEPRLPSASSDPAMAFGLPLNGRVDHSTRHEIGSGLAAGCTADQSGIRCPDALVWRI